MSAPQSAPPLLATVESVDCPARRNPRLKPRPLGLIPQPHPPTGLRVSQGLVVGGHACMSLLLVERALCAARCSQRSASPT